MVHISPPRNILWDTELTHCIQILNAQFNGRLVYINKSTWHTTKRIYERFASLRSNSAGMFKGTNRTKSGKDTVGRVIFYVQETGAIKIRSVAVNAKSNCGQTVF